MGLGENIPPKNLSRYYLDYYLDPGLYPTKMNPEI